MDMISATLTEENLRDAFGMVLAGYMAVQGKY